HPLGTGRNRISTDSAGRGGRAQASPGPSGAMSGDGRGQKEGASMGYEAPGLGEGSPVEPHSQPGDAIGAPLEAARAALLDLTTRLGGLLGEHAGPLLDVAKRQLQERSCRIAVIGQIKAGKSTFINALARRPGLLPTDINPWTVVVTALHFRSAPTPP